MTTISNKVAVITGAASGIGQATAVMLAHRGAAHIVAIDLDQCGLDETANHIKQLGVGVSTFTIDVSSRQAIYDAAETVATELGGADIVINNAGISMINPLSNISYEDFESVMNINFWSVVYGSKAFLPQLQAKGGGHIVNVSSVLGLFTSPNMGAYSCSKFAIRGFTETLRQEVLDIGINVSCVYPGGVKTNIVKNTRHANELSPQERKQAADAFAKSAGKTAEQAAEIIVRGIERNKNRIILGKDARIIDWLVRIVPASYDRLIAGYSKRQLAKVANDK